MSGQGNILILAAPAVLKPWVVLADAWRTWLADWRNPYRPEKHYMRGPGPKWREKHARDRNSTER